MYTLIPHQQYMDEILREAGSRDMGSRYFGEHCSIDRRSTPSDGRYFGKCTYPYHDSRAAGAPSAGRRILSVLEFLALEFLAGGGGCITTPNL